MFKKHFLKIHDTCYQKKISRKKQETLGKICKINCQNKKINRDIERLSGQNCPQHNNRERSEK